MRGALAAVAAAAAALSVSAADSSTHGAPWAGLTCEGLLRGGLLPEAYRCAAAKASAGGEGASHDGYVAALARVAAGEQAMHCVHRFAFEEGTGQDTDVSEAMRRCHGLVELADGARTEGELRWAADLGHWPARAELARLVASMGRWDEARGLLRHVVLEGAAHLDEEAHAKALLMLGVAETAIGDVDTAIQTLEEATRAYPSSRAAPRAHKLLTGIYGTRGDRSSMSRHAVFAAAMNHEFFAAAAPDGNAGASSAEPHALEPDLIGVPTPNPRVADGGAAVRRGGRTGDDERLNRAVFREPVAPLLQGLALMREGPRQRVAELLRAHVGGDSRDQGAAAEPAATAEAASERQFASFRALAARGDAFSGCSDAQIGVDDTVAVWARVTRDDWETRGAVRRNAARDVGLAVALTQESVPLQVLVDAGANVGDFAVAAGRAFGLAEGGEEGWRGPAAADRLSSTCGSPQQPPTVVWCVHSRRNEERHCGAPLTALCIHTRLCPAVLCPQCGGQSCDCTAAFGARGSDGRSRGCRHHRGDCRCVERVGVSGRSARGRVRGPGGGE